MRLDLLHRVFDRRSTELMAAIIFGNDSEAFRLIDIKDDLDACDGSGRTALIHAIDYGRHEVASRLLDEPIDLFVVDDIGKTAFGHACIANAPELIANISKKMEHGKTRPR